jgi:LDH2 family malate/lactate/ureidoglycolate dehydrogenase
MDIMSSVLTVAGFGGQVGDRYKDAKPQDAGHCFIAIKPDVCFSVDDLKARMDTLVQRVHGVIPAPGFSEVLFPGEPEQRLCLQRRREGIPYADAERKMFTESAKQYGVPELLLSETPLSV